MVNINPRQNFNSFKTFGLKVWYWEAFSLPIALKVGNIASKVRKIGLNPVTLCSCDETAVQTFDVLRHQVTETFKTNSFHSVFSHFLYLENIVSKNYHQL